MSTLEKTESPSVSVNGKSLSFSETFLVRDNEEILIDTMVDGWRLKITIVMSNSEAGKPPSLTWSALSENHAKIELVGWNDSRGIATQTPAQIGHTDTTNRAVFFAACSQKIGSINRLDFQIHLGEKV